jgi:hypothetical protein
MPARALTEDEKKAGLIRPLRRKYIHFHCGKVSTLQPPKPGMTLDTAETFAKDPAFFGSMLCQNCGMHFRCVESGERRFGWCDDFGQPDGSLVGE